MKKMFFVISVLAMMLLVSACEENGDDTQETTNPFRGGTESLSISFDNNNPPSEAFSDTPFYVGLNIRNTGEHTVDEDDMEVTIRGVNHESYGLSEGDLVKTPSTTLDGTVYDIDRNVIQGTEDYMEFGPFEYQDDLSSTINVPIQANACYSYGTDVVTELCIKEEVTRDEEGDVCNVNEEKKYFNSAGPVQVTSVRQSPRGSSAVSFNFQVEHKGVGSLYSKGASCDTDDSAVTENEVYVEVDGPSGMECSTLGSSTSGTIRLSEGSGRLVSCTVDVSDATSAYIEPVDISLDYTHKQTQTTTLDLKPVD